MAQAKEAAALTTAQRQALHRQRRADEAARWKAALVQIETAKTLKEAREIAATALGKTT